MMINIYQKVNQFLW